jgi:hypothetical protein
MDRENLFKGMFRKRVIELFSDCLLSSSSVTTGGLQLRRGMDTPP